MCGEKIKKEQSRSDKKLEKDRREKKDRKNDKSEGEKEKINFWLILLLYYYYVTSYKIILL